jgi:hypothetical protein
MRRLIPLGAFWTVIGTAAAAQASSSLEQRYPAGSITTPAQAERALADADTTQQAVESRYKAEAARCAHVVLVTECQDAARRERTLGQAKVRRVEVEAHDLQRKLASEQRATQRRAQVVQQRQQEAARPAKEQAAQKAAQHRSDQAEENAQEALQQEAQAPANRERYEQRNAQHERDQVKNVSVKLRDVAENERRYQDKQARAKAYAVSRAREREENQKARDEKDRKRKAQAADVSRDSTADPPK